MNSTLMTSNWGRYIGKKMMKPRQKFKPVHDTTHWNIVKGDRVKVTQGRKMGEEGTVIAVLRKVNQIIVEGCNMRKRIQKAKGDGIPAKFIVKPCAIHYSNVMLIDPTTGLPTKVSRRYLEDGEKVRVSKKSGQLLPKPDPLLNRIPRLLAVGPKDTMAASVFEVTFKDYEKFLPFIYANEKAKRLVADDLKSEAKKL